jgi:hypothetical protein
MSEPNWIIVTLIGALIGAIVSQYWTIFFYPIRRLKHDPLLGTWYDYHFTFVHGRRYLAASAVVVKRGLLTSRSIRMQDQDLIRYSEGPEHDLKDGLSYKGVVLVEGPHLLIKLHATTHNEFLVFRLINRLPSNSSMVPGVWMSFDHELNPTAGIMMFSRQKLDTDIATNLLVNMARIERGVLQVPLSERARRKIS